MLESLKEFTTSTFNTAMNRVKNPAFGAFAISWCAFNWKSILYLFLSDYGVYDKINYISENSSWLTVILYQSDLLFFCADCCLGLTTTYQHGRISRLIIATLLKTTARLNVFSALHAYSDLKLSMM